MAQPAAGLLTSPPNRELIALTVPRCGITATPRQTPLHGAREQLRIGHETICGQIRYRSRWGDQYICRVLVQVVRIFTTGTINRFSFSRLSREREPILCPQTACCQRLQNAREISEALYEPAAAFCQRRLRHSMASLRSARQVFTSSLLSVLAENWYRLS